MTDNEHGSAAWLWSAPAEGHYAPARRASTAWAPCGARTRLGRPCRAPGAGIGGRCIMHGGCGVGSFVLLSGAGPFERWTHADGTLSPRTWSTRLVPAELWRSVTRDGAEDFDSLWPDWRPAADVHRNHARVRRCWPALVGLRVARRMLERGRITRCIVDGPRTARKLRTLRPPSWSDQQWADWVDRVALL